MDLSHFLSGLDALRMLVWDGDDSLMSWTHPVVLPDIFRIALDALPLVMRCDLCRVFFRQLLRDALKLERPYPDGFLFVVAMPL